MTELSDDAKAFLDDLRDVDDPMPQTEDRVYGAVLQAVAVGSAATAGTAIASGVAAQGTAVANTAVTNTAVAASATAAIVAVTTTGTTSTGVLSTGVVAKVLAVTLLAGGAVGTTAVVVDVYDLPSEQPHNVVLESGETEEGVTQVPTAPELGDPVSPQVEPSPPVVATPQEPVTEPPFVVERTHPAVVRAPATRPAVTAADPEPAREDPLVEEVRLIQQADAARRSGNASLALSLLIQHAERFPQGQLARDRQVSRVLALCDAGRAMEARSLGARLMARFGDTPLAARIENSCAGAER